LIPVELWVLNMCNKWSCRFLLLLIIIKTNRQSLFFIQESQHFSSAFLLSCNFQSSFNLVNFVVTLYKGTFTTPPYEGMWWKCKTLHDRQIQWNNRENNLSVTLLSQTSFTLTRMILCNLSQDSSTVAICHPLWCNLMGSFLKWIMDYGLPLYINNRAVSFM